MQWATETCKCTEIGDTVGLLDEKREKMRDEWKTLTLLSWDCATNSLLQSRRSFLCTVHRRSHHSSHRSRNIGYVPPTDTGSLCLAVDSTHTVVGLFRLLVRRSGTHCSQMNSEIRRVMSTASNSSLKQSCSALTSVTSALQVIFNVMRSIYPRFTYLLTYLRKAGVSNNRNTKNDTARHCRRQENSRRLSSKPNQNSGSNRTG